MSTLTPYLRTTIDEKWDHCWPVSSLRPVAILDLLSYLFFIKKLDDRQWISGKWQLPAGDPFMYTRETEEFTWRKLKDMDPQQIHQLFTRQFGLMDLMSRYSRTGLLYSELFKQPVLITPTPKLLLNAIDLINLIDSTDDGSRPAVADYLFEKIQAGQQPSEFIPDYACHLMVSVAAPAPQDVIWDPSAGNGNLLTGALKYVASHAVGRPRWSGTEQDIIQLRIATMHMILHGINDPRIGTADKVNVPPTLILSSLLNPAVEVKITESNRSPARLEKETALLNQVLAAMEKGSRAVVLVSESFLNSSLPEVLTIRRTILDHFRLEGVINLTPKSHSVFSCAGILIFNKPLSVTNDAVWFCKMEKSRKKLTVNEALGNTIQNDPVLSQELNEVNFVLNKWKSRDESVTARNSFYLEASDIRANQYNLNMNDYKLIPATDGFTPADQPVTEGSSILPARKENLHHFFEGSIPLPERRRKSKIIPAVIVLLLLIAAAFTYFFYFKDGKTGYISRMNTHTFSGKPSEPVAPSIAGSAKDTASVPSRMSNRSGGKGMAVSAGRKQTATAETSPLKEVRVSLPDTGRSDDTAAVPEHYTVVNKAWFYYKPDSTKRKSLYLQPREDLVIIPSAEENGFVYVVYVNKKGQSTKGWLNKKDLEPL